jgi:signal transduction histidine kinase
MQMKLAQILGQRPLSFQLFLLVAATALPLLLTSLVMYSRLVANERENLGDSLFLHAKTLAALVEGEVETHAAVGATLARSPALQAGNLELFWREASEALEFVPGSWINVDTPTGSTILSTLAPPGTKFPASGELDLIKRAFATGQYQVGDLTIGPISSTLRSSVLVPVYRNEVPLYVVTIGLDPARLFDLVKRNFTKGEIIGVLDRNKKFIARIPDHENRVGTMASEGWRAAMASASEGINAHQTLEGDWILNGYALTRHGWTAGVGLLESEISSPLATILWSSALVAAAMTFLSIVLVIVIGRHASGGMAAIADAARQVGKGEVVDPLPAPFTEAATISRTLAETSFELKRRGDELQRANAQLEIKVAERTRDLLAEMQRREEAEATLRQAQKIESVGQLTGGIAHDFNNMLTIINGNLDTIKRRIKSGKVGDLSKPVEAALQGAQNAAKLTHRLLAFSRQQPLDPSPLNLNTLVSGISELLARTVGESIRVETVLSTGLWMTLADSNQVENAVLNLAVNARDAMPNGGTLTIETANVYLDDLYASKFGDLKPGQYVQLSVTDTGTGISKELLDRIFEPFFTTKGPGLGTGLGLAMVHGFVKQSGGHVRVYSEVGEGTAVKLYLPRWQGDNARTSAAPRGLNNIANETQVPAQAGESILLVEDDAGVRDYAVGVLEELGYRVHATESAEKALSVLQGIDRVDLLFTDVVLGGKLSGRQLADEVKRLRPELPILFTTGYTRNPIVDQGRLDSGVSLLNKPYTQRDLSFKIRSILGNEKAGKS